MQQKIALEILKTGHNVFLTGAAGSGKTYLLNQYIHYLKSKKKAVAVTASTGIAATHLDGRTIHSWSGLGIKNLLNKKDLKKIVSKRPVKMRILKTEVLIIDEISMLSADQLDAVNQICQAVRKTWLPFGGIQTIFCGDFFQLPPVRKNSQSSSLFAFHSRSWETMELKICYLEEQYRQKDSLLSRLLNSIRQNAVDEKIKKSFFINSQKNLTNFRPTQLFTHNVDVDKINSRELAVLPGKTFSYRMHMRGKENLSELLKKGCLAPEKLLLKRGAQVMFVKNNFSEGYVNGTLGKVVDFEEETKLPIVQTLSGEKIVVQPVSWLLEENDQILASLRQLPLRLAWAITVHKSQGMSLDAVEVDLGKSFELGMGYVALSRAKTFSGLKVLAANDLAFQVDEQIIKKDRQFFQDSAEFQKEWEKSTGKKKLK